MWTLSLASTGGSTGSGCRYGSMSRKTCVRRGFPIRRATISRLIALSVCLSRISCGFCTRTSVRARSAGATGNISVHCSTDRSAAAARFDGWILWRVPSAAASGWGSSGLAFLRIAPARSAGIHGLSGPLAGIQCCGTNSDRRGTSFCMSIGDFYWWISCLTYSTMIGDRTVR